MRKLTLSTLFTIITFLFAIAQEDIAITEWISNPLVNENTDEWIELYNFGSTNVDLANWRLQDEDIDDALITSSSFIMLPGSYAILASNKTAFEAAWHNGASLPNVFQVSMTLSNGLDEIVLKNGSGIIVWSVAYQNDETAGRATHYTEASYTTRIWGSKAATGVRRDGNDITTGTLGYERNNATADPLVWTATTGDIGSPLSSQTLPVELFNFYGEAIGDEVKLHWRTMSELNNDRFEIQKSLDGIDFNIIGSINGQINSSIISDYSFSDTKPSTGRNYYRLKQVDLDGKMELSEIIVIDLKIDSEIRLFPTLTFNHVTITTGGASSILIINANGQIMESRSDKVGNYGIEMSYYPQGIYYVTINKNDRIFTKRMIKL